MSAPKLRSNLALCAGVAVAQGPDSNAARAARTARFTSSSVASGAVAHG